MGNWLTAEQGRHLLGVFDRNTLRGIRDYAMVAVLLGCGLRRAEVAALRVQDLQQREEHWVFADLVGKGCHVRTVSSPTLGCECTPNPDDGGEDHGRADLPRDQQSGPDCR
jgi:site-specific recombinase XerD